MAALLSGCCFFVVFAAAQDYYMFHRIQVAQGNYEVLQTLGIETSKNEFFTVGLTANTIASNWNLVSLKITKDSVTILNRINAVDTNMIAGWYGSAFEDNNNLIVGGSAYFSNKTRPLIVKYNPITGDTVFIKIIERDSSSAFNQGKLTPEGDYLFIGQSTDLDYFGDFYLVKTDSTGAVIWEKIYGTEERDNGLSVNLAADGGYLLFGSSRGYGGFIGVYSDALLIKIDQNGNEQWRTSWGGFYSDCNWNIEPTADSGFVACGCIAEENSEAFQGYIRRMDKDGNVIWEKTFERDSKNGSPIVFRMSRVLENGWVAAAGQGVIVINDSTVHWAPWLVIFDEEGKILMNRGYTSIFLGPQSEATFEDIRLTSDGGFIAGGTYYPSVGDTGNQDMFILKLDSNGCEYPNCQPPLSVAPSPANEPAFRAYPNPFNESIVFEIGEANAGSILIMDLRGVSISSLIVKEKQTTVSFDGRGLAAGIYFASVVDQSGQPHTLKIIMMLRLLTTNLGQGTRNQSSVKYIKPKIPSVKLKAKLI